MLLVVDARILVLVRCPCCRRTASGAWPQVFADCGLCGERVALPWRWTTFVA